MPRGLVGQLVCIVQDCSARTRRTTLAVFPGPKCAGTQKLWKEALEQPIDGDIEGPYGVCELHFSEEYLVREKQSIWLNPGAVPNSTVKGARLPVRCRMCAKSERTTMENTVSKLSKDKQLLPVLRICLDLENTKHRKLPDGVCEGCTSMVRFIGRYAESCWNAQNELLKQCVTERSTIPKPWKRARKYENHSQIIVIPTEAASPDLVLESSNLETISTKLQHDPLDAEEALQVLTSIGLVTSDTDDGYKQELVGENILPEELSSEIKTEPIVYLDDSDEQQNITTESTSLPSNCRKMKTKSLSNLRKSPFRKSTKSDTTSNVANKQHIRSLRARNYECGFCLQSFDTQGTLERHIRLHERELDEYGTTSGANGKELDFIRCLQCRTQYRTALELKEHINLEHANQTDCLICGEKFKRKSRLDEHVIRTHGAIFV
ncbi:uncharacterized protein LOC131677520 [Topomyia yanbarensis]|uniref:uncharacterized protein LOC131677520 n=1 Tax=Topomyia yanbarensis TaxID=2498891 RepID=UPI00273ABDBF|nr:uncharacterized protein LOC131677520 [Topomyia yanbarensis]